MSENKKKQNKFNYIIKIGVAIPLYFLLTFLVVILNCFLFNSLHNIFGNGCFLFFYFMLLCIATVITLMLFIGKTLEKYLIKKEMRENV